MRGWEALLGVSRPDLETEFQGRPSKPGHSGAELLLAGANDQVLQNCFRLLAVAGGGGGVWRWRVVHQAGLCCQVETWPRFCLSSSSTSSLCQRMHQKCTASPVSRQMGSRHKVAPCLIVTHQPTTSNTITFLGGVAGRVGNEPFMRFEVAKSQRRFPTRAFIWFNVAITAFAFKNL